MSNFEIIFILLLTLHAVAHCVHFNSAVITAKPLSDAGGGFMNVEFTVKIGYTRTRHFCDQNTITSGTYLSEADGIECVIGCIGPCVSGRCEQIGTTRIRCTAFSIINDWVTGEDKFVATIPKRSVYCASTQRGDWRVLQVFSNGQMGWEVRITLDSTIRPDIGTMNTTPVTFIPPVLQLRAGTKYTLKIPTYDVDGDNVRCRWAQSAKGECAGICQTVPFAVLNATACTLEFDLTATAPGAWTVGWYGAAIQVEDFQTATSTTPYSSVPVQFLITIDGATSSCSKPPKIPSDACIAIPIGSTFSSKVIATVQCPGVSITEIQVIGPYGTKSTVSAPLPGNNKKWFSDINWTPDPTSTGGNMICVLATDDNNMSSDLSCFIIVYGFTPPMLDANTASPKGTLSSAILLGVGGYVNFQISFTSTVMRPTRSTFIVIYRQDGTEFAQFEARNASEVAFSGLNMTFRVPVYDLTPGSYYILFDLGVGVGPRALPTLCDPDSMAVVDNTFWTFTVPPSPLSLNGLNGVCKEVLVGELVNERYTAGIGYVGATYLKSINFTGQAATATVGTLTAIGASSWYRDLTWNSPTRGMYVISITATDNINQIAQRTFNLSVVDISADPSLKPGTGEPSSVLTDSFLGGKNGFMTFKIQFKSAYVSRATAPAYLRVYSSSGIEFARLECSTSGFVYYIADTMFFDIPVDTFPPGNYYVLFDQAVATSASLCTPVSPAITSSSFWTFTVPANFTGYMQNVASPTPRDGINTCTAYTECNASSFMLLMCLLPAAFFTLHLVMFLVFKRCLRTPIPVAVEVHPYYFQLMVPNSYKFSAKDNQDALNSSINSN